MQGTGGRGRPLTWLLIGCIVLSLLAGLAFYRPFQSKAQVPPDDVSTLSRPLPLPEKRTTFLVMGVDARYDDGGRADSIAVVSYDPAAQRLAMLSIARDTWVQVPGHGYDKINHAYAYGGEKLAVTTVERLLGIPIDNYITISFAGFQKIIDALGGIEINAEKRMEYTDPTDLSMGPDGLVIDIEPGPQRMDGITALGYARFRNDDEGDLGRIRRQQQVAFATMKEAARPVVIAKLPQLIPALSDTVVTNLSLAEIIRLAGAGRDSLSGGLKTNTFGGEPTAIEGVYYLIPDLRSQRVAAYETLVGSPPADAFRKRAVDDQTTYDKALQDALAEEAAASAAAAAAQAAQTAQAKPQTPTTPPKTGTTTPPKAQQPPAPKPVTVTLIDASGKGLLTQYSNALKAAGFRVAAMKKASKVEPKSRLIDHAGQPGTLDRVRKVISSIEMVVQLDPKAGTALEIILGADLVPAKTQSQPQTQPKR